MFNQGESCEAALIRFLLDCFSVQHQSRRTEMDQSVSVNRNNLSVWRLRVQIPPVLNSLFSPEDPQRTVSYRRLLLWKGRIIGSSADTILSLWTEQQQDVSPSAGSSQSLWDNNMILNKNTQKCCFINRIQKQRFYIFINKHFSDFCWTSLNQSVSMATAGAHQSCDVQWSSSSGSCVQLFMTKLLRSADNQLT